MDGARLFNACLAGGYSLRDVGSLVDSVSICFSKGLGCPMGSILVGRKELIHKARRARKVFGGALRQAGMVAAAAHYALDHHVDRLKDDHANARRLADRLAKIDGVTIDPTRVETNLVFFEIDPGWGTAAPLSAALREQGVRINPSSGPQRLRACTHLDVDAAAVDSAADIVARVLASPRPGDGQSTRSSNADGPYAASR
jgi:threonine aldolase